MKIPLSCAELKKNVDINEYQMISFLSKRTRELMFGAKPLVDDKNESFIAIAIRELLSKKIKPQL